MSYEAMVLHTDTITRPRHATATKAHDRAKTHNRYIKADRPSHESKSASELLLGHIVSFIAQWI